MSKLHDIYLKLKSNDSSKIYLFKSGIFYIALDMDAILLSSKMGLKLTNLNAEVMKCSFPTSSIIKYSNILKQFNINFDIVEDYFESISSQRYINNFHLSSFIKKFNKLDVDYLSVAEAYDLLYNLKSVINNIEEL